MRLIWTLALPLLVACAAGDPFAVEVVEFLPGEGAGFGQEGLPEIVLGPPKGGGLNSGSLDVISLGVGGSIELRLGRPAIDLEGPDLIVFENAFVALGTEQRFTEPCLVEVAGDDREFVAFDCDPSREAPNGCAGQSPVFAHLEDERVSPTDPVAAGGDAFDLAELGLDRVTLVRITDLSSGGSAPSAGCDIDAIAVSER